MKKIFAFGIIAVILFMSIGLIYNLSNADMSTEGNALENIEAAVSENIPFRDSLSGLMDSIRYFSGVRRFDGIYIGSEGSLLRDIEAPNGRTFSLAKNYILSFSDKNQIKPYFMLIPTASSVLQQEIDGFAADEMYNQRNMINNMYSMFEGKVRTTDIYQTLYDHRGEYIYYHTEDLPTSLGGYYIYTELCSRLGIEQMGLDTFSCAYAAHGFYGSLASDFFKPYCEPDFISLYEYIGQKQSITVEHYGSKGIIKVSDSIFVQNENFEDKTDMIFGGLSGKIEINHFEKGNEYSSILIFGDESAKSWLPFLIPNYKRLTFVNLNTCSKELLYSVKTEEYSQVLFAYSTANFVKGADFEKLEFVG